VQEAVKSMVASEPEEAASGADESGSEDPASPSCLHLSWPVFRVVCKPRPHDILHFCIVVGPRVMQEDDDDDEPPPDFYRDEGKMTKAASTQPVFQSFRVLVASHSVVRLWRTCGLHWVA